LYEKDSRLACVTKNELFDGLKTPLLNSYQKVLEYKSRQIMFGHLTFSVDETCFIKSDGNCIVAKIYDFEKKVFRRVDKKMSMKNFMEEHNEQRDFIRCHASFIVNKRMIKRIDKAGSYLVLMMKDENDDEIQIPISATYRKETLTQLKGLY
jgi:hypothetical protein